MAFSPDEISQILEEFFKTVGTRQYLGARYVPIFGRKGEDSIQWDSTAPYEPLTIVQYQGDSYTSRQYVPAGVAITNQDFWALTGNYNAQIEAYRADIAQIRTDMGDLQEDMTELATTLQEDMTELATTVGTEVSGVQADVRNIQDHTGIDSSKQLTIIAVDAGSNTGDCSFVMDDAGTVGMIDCLFAETVSNVLYAINAYGISKISYVIFSHYHADHVGGFLSGELDGFFDNDTFFILAPAPPSIDDGGNIERYTQVLSKIQQGGWSYVTPDANYTYTSGDLVYNFINLDWSIYTGSNYDYNNCSMFSILDWNGKKIGFSGDVHIAAQKYLTGKLPTFDLYKAHHHGSDLAQNMPYMASIKPRYSYVCCMSGDSRYFTYYVRRGYRNITSDLGIETWTTGYNGTFSMVMHGDGSITTTAKPDNMFDFSVNAASLIWATDPSKETSAVTLTELVNAIPPNASFNFRIHRNDWPLIFAEASNIFNKDSYTFFGARNDSNYFDFLIFEDVRNSLVAECRVLNGVPHVCSHPNMWEIICTIPANSTYPDTVTFNDKSGFVHSWNSSNHTLSVNDTTNGLMTYIMLVRATVKRASAGSGVLTIGQNTFPIYSNDRLESVTFLNPRFNNMGTISCTLDAEVELDITFIQSPIRNV